MLACSAAVRPLPFRYAFLLRSRTSPDFLVWAFATLLLTPVVAFAGMRLTLPQVLLDTSSTSTYPRRTILARKRRAAPRRLTSQGRKEIPTRLHLTAPSAIDNHMYCTLPRRLMVVRGPH
jgi:hypothetical protein